MKNIFSKDSRQKAASAKPFPKAVQDLADKDTQAKVIIYEKSGLKTKYLGEIPIAEALDFINMMEAMLLEEYGGGDYQLSLCNRDSEVLAKYNYFIAGQPKNRRKMPDDPDAANKKITSRSSDDMLVSVLGKLADAAISQRGNSAEEWERSIRLAKELHGDDGDMRQLQRELMGGLIQSLLNPKETAFEDYFRFFQMIKEIQPVLQPEDPMMSILNSALPLLSQLFGAKLSGLPPQINQNQMEQLQQYLQRIQGQPALQASQAPLPTPPGKHEQPSPAPLGAAPEPQNMHKVFDALIRRFRESIINKASPQEIAQKIISLVNFAHTWTPDNPHPLLKGLINQSSMDDLSRGMEIFFAGIPELAEDSEKKSEIMTELTRILIMIMGEEDVSEEEQKKEDAATTEPGLV